MSHSEETINPTVRDAQSTEDYNPLAKQKAAAFRTSSRISIIKFVKSFTSRRHKPTPVEGARAVARARAPLAAMTLQVRRMLPYWAC